MKVVLLCKMAGKRGGVPTHRNCQADINVGFKNGVGNGFHFTATKEKNKRTKFTQ